MALLSRRKILSASALGSVATLTTSAPQAVAAASGTGEAQAGDHVIRPETFGAIADGKTDCTRAFMDAIAAATRGNYIADRQRNLPIVLAAGGYRLTQPIHLSSTDLLVSGAGRQNTVLLIDHNGPGLVIDGGGDLEIRGLAIGASAARKSGKSGDGLVCTPKAGTNFTYFVSLIDVTVFDHPGNGFTIFAPEGLRMENVRAVGNGGDGCLLDARALENICNKIDFARFSNNGGIGLNAIQVANSIFSRVECLNNRGQCQMRVNGDYNTIEYTDCEGYNIYNGQHPAPGLILSGKGNIVQNGDFYKLSTAISLQGAHDCRVIMPKLEGAASAPLLIGIDIAQDCTRNTIDFVDGHLTTTKVRDLGTNNRITAGGVIPLADAAPVARAQQASGGIAPDLSGGHTVTLIADGPLQIKPPVNARPGAIFTLVIDTQARGLRALTFHQAYRGIGEHVAINADRRYLTCAFVATEEGRCLPHAMFSYD